MSNNEEFQYRNIAKQIQKLCDKIPDCKGCPFHADYGCRIDGFPCDWDVEDKGE